MAKATKSSTGDSAVSTVTDRQISSARLANSATGDNGPRWSSTQRALPSSVEGL